VARDQTSARGLDRSLHALDRLASAAGRVGTKVLVRHGRRYVDLPSPRELTTILRELGGAELAPACDLPGAHLLDLMGFQSLDATLATYGGPLNYVGDACGPVGALAPGQGLLEVGALRQKLPAAAGSVFAPWIGLTADELSTAVIALG
jgi:hypothetical protein